MKQKLLIIVLVTVFAGALGGCGNTLSGFGHDMQSGGEWIQRQFE